MTDIYIVNHSISGPYAQCFSSYHSNEPEALNAFADCIDSVGEDPALIEIIRLDTVTLDATTIRGWEGTIADLESQEDDEGDE